MDAAMRSAQDVDPFSNMGKHDALDIVSAAACDTKLGCPLRRPPRASAAFQPLGFLRLRELGVILLVWCPTRTGILSRTP